MTRATPQTDPALASLAARDPRYAALFARLDGEEAESLRTRSVAESRELLRQVNACPHFSRVCPCEFGECKRPETLGPKSCRECFACVEGRQNKTPRRVE